ncbi:MAG: hypothetical protein PHX21_03140 [bacterium]|nr:hypothetical protein [bacterium]
MKNKITLLLIGLLISALLPGTGKTENIGFKIPQMFCFSESFSNYKSSGNTFSIKNGVWQGEIPDEPPSGGIGACALESFGSLIGGAIGSVPSLLCAFQTLYILYDGSYQYKDIVIGTGLCIATSFIIPLGSAAGTSLAGSIMSQESSFKKAYRGALKGGLLAWGVSATALTVIALCDPESRSTAPTIGIAFTLPIMAFGCIIGSVNGYNK